MNDRSSAEGVAGEDELQQESSSKTTAPRSVRGRKTSDSNVDEVLGFSTAPAPPKRAPLPFIAAEVLLVLMIPILAWLGFSSLLGSTAGQFVDQAGPGEPGWQAFVDASPITLVVDVVDGAVAGASIITQPG